MSDSVSERVPERASERASERVPDWERDATRLLILVAATAYAVLGLVKLNTFQASTFDLVIFDQAVRNYSHFQPPAVPAAGVAYGAGAGHLQLADHFSPILALLAPLYWLHDGPQTLIVAQALLLAAAIVPIRAFTRRRLGRGATFLVCLAYAVSWPVAQAAWFDFHEVAFVPLLTAIAIERLDADRLLPGSAAVLALLLVKEDMGLMVLGFGGYLFATRRRLEGVALALVGVGALLLIRGGLMPLLGADPQRHWAYHDLGTDIPGVLGALAADPLAALGRLVSPDTKVDMIAWLLWPTLLACLFSPLSLAALPQVAERLLADKAQWWDTQFHYNAFVVAILICAGVDGAVRLRDRLARSARTRPLTAGFLTHWAVAVCAVALTLTPRFALGQLAEPAFYSGGPDQRVAAGWAAVAQVPSGVTVEAVNHAGPALTARATVLLWDGTARQAEWIVADVLRPSFPFGSLDDQRRRVEEARQSGYRTVFERDGYVVLRRT